MGRSTKKIAMSKNNKIVKTGERRRGNFLSKVLSPTLPSLFSFFSYSSLCSSFLTRECAHAHERVIAIVDFSLGRSVGWLVGWFGC